MNSGGLNPGRHPQAGLQLNELPAQVHMVQLINAAQKGLDRNHWIHWPGLQPGVTFSLGVICRGQQSKKAWQPGQKTVAAEPEWSLWRETDANKTELWTVTSHDAEHIHLLAVQETTGGLQEPEGMDRSFASNVVGEVVDKSRLPIPELPPAIAIQPNLGMLQPVFNQNQPALAPAAMGLGQTPLGFGQAPPGFGQSPLGGLVPPGLPQIPPISPAMPPEPFASSVASGGAQSLAGSLKDMDFAKVMQSISDSKMNGKLEINLSQQQAQIFFADGEPMHAELNKDLQTASKLIGDIVLFELFLWNDGSFKFQDGLKTTEHTVKKLMQVVLTEGTSLREYQHALTQEGLNNGATLCMSVSASAISETEFDSRMLLDGLPVHIDLQKKVFIGLRAPLSLESLLANTPMPRSVWLPIIFNLVNLDLATITAGSSAEAEEPKMFVELDESIAAAHKALTEPSSGMHSYNNFLLSARNELARNQFGSSPFCIAMLEMSVGSDLSAVAMNSIAAAFLQVGRPFDVLAHLSPSYLFILLPHADSVTGTRLMGQFIALLSETQLDERTHGRSFATRGGIACAPADGAELVDVLNCAHKNCSRASATNAILSSVS